MNVRSFSRSAFIKNKLRAAGALHRHVVRPDGTPLRRKAVRDYHLAVGKKIDLPRGTVLFHGGGRSVVEQPKKVTISTILTYNRPVRWSPRMEKVALGSEPDLVVTPEGQVCVPGNFSFVYRGHKGTVTVCLPA